MGVPYAMALKYEAIKNPSKKNFLARLWSLGVFSLVVFFGAVLFGVWMTQQQVVTKAQSSEAQKAKASIAELKKQMSTLQSNSKELRENIKAKIAAISVNYQQMKEARDTIDRALAGAKKSPKSKTQSQKMVSDSVEKVALLQKQNEMLFEELVAVVNPSQP